MPAVRIFQTLWAIEKAQRSSSAETQLTAGALVAPDIESEYVLIQKIPDVHHQASPGQDGKILASRSTFTDGAAEVLQNVFTFVSGCSGADLLLVFCLMQMVFYEYSWAPPSAV